MTTVFKQVQNLVASAVHALETEGALSLKTPMPELVVEPPRDPAHGDVATNAAMLLTRAAGKPPRVIAELIKAKLQAHPLVSSVEIAGPGFINLRLSNAVWADELKTILAEGVHYGDATLGRKERVNVEFVSANPTGPMHAGHVRGAVLGDSLCNLLAKTGYDVTREYYFNDGGTQVDVLARTTHLRYREALGEDIGAIPEGLYPGDYLKEVGEGLAKRDGKKWVGLDEAEWLAPVRNFAVEWIMGMIRDDLKLIGIKHDVFTNERDNVTGGLLEKVFGLLQEKGLVYEGILPPPKGKVMEDWEAVPLTLFRSSQFGDSSDRPLKKRDGSWAYVMPDLAYHYDKIQRGFTLLIDVWGKDHGAYVDRIRPIVDIFGDGRVTFSVLFNNIVKVLKNGVPVKLSKRSGNIITLREMVEQVGSGAVRFFMLTRVPDSELEFDFAKAVEQTRDNPVFYVQYAHARCCSILRHAAELFAGRDLSADALAKVDLSLIASAEEMALVKGLANWPRVVEAAAVAQEPHRIAFFMMELAALFHSLWNKGNDNASLRFIIQDQPELTLARLALIKATQTVIASGLAVVGCEPLEELRNECPV